MAGYDNGIVNIRAHLDGADDQIGQEEKVAVAERRHREVAPDTALDDQDQQYRQAAGPEGEQQHQDYKRNRQNADEQIIMLKGGTEVEAAGRIADEITLVEIPCNQTVQNIQIRIAFLALGRQIQFYDNSAPVIALQLELGVLQFFFQIVQLIFGLLREINGNLLPFVEKVVHQVQQRNAVIVKICQDLAVVVLRHGIPGIQNTDDIVVYVSQFRKLPGRESTCYHVSILNFDICKAGYRDDCRKLLDFMNQFFFPVIVSGRDDDRHLVCFSEGFPDQLIGNLGVVFADG